ncbi:hypothetical protein Goarm_011874, partial [Gossypium armourianum]|nr:hypothetical protein [Gossypium armourianum]
EELYNTKLEIGSLGKLCDILDDLDILIDRGYNNVLVMTDSLEVATVVQKGLTGGSNSVLFRRILQRVPRFQHWNIYHTPREANQEADRLVKLTHLE